MAANGYIVESLSNGLVRVKSLRGAQAPLVLETYATADLPNAANYPVGYHVFDTTLSVPKYSNGSAWVLAAAEFTGGTVANPTTFESAVTMQAPLVGDVGGTLPVTGDLDITGGVFASGAVNAQGSVIAGAGSNVQGGFGVFGTSVTAPTSISTGFLDARGDVSLGNAPTDNIGEHGAAGGAQGAAIADAAGGATVDAEARTAINAVLAYLRTRGSIAT